VLLEMVVRTLFCPNAPTPGQIWGSVVGPGRQETGDKAGKGRGKDIRICDFDQPAHQNRSVVGRASKSQNPIHFRANVQDYNRSRNWTESTDLRTLHIRTYDMLRCCHLSRTRVILWFYALYQWSLSMSHWRERPHPEQRPFGFRSTRRLQLPCPKSRF
jgi:hypothetical protein